MATPTDRENQNDQSRRESGQQGQSLDPTNNHNHQEQQPTPPLPSGANYPAQPMHQGYPPAYPPPPGYGQAPPGYPPPPGPYPYYQNGYNQQPYPYAQPPPAAYYNNGNYNPHYQDQYVYQNNGAGFIRGVLLAMIFLITLTILSTLITYIVLHPEIPSFQVENFSVSNFNVSSPRFISNWEANLTVVNSNTKLKVDLGSIHSYIFYKGNELASSIMNSESLDKMQNVTVATSLTSNIADEAVIGDLSKDRAGGKVIVSLRMSAYSTFTSGTWWTKHSFMRVFCEDMTIVLAPGASTGGLAPDTNKECLQSYPPPPQHSVYPPQYNNYNPNPYTYPNPNPNPNPRRRLLMMLIISFILILGLISFITWLVFKPRVPIFRIDSATVTGLNTTQTGLTGTWNFTMLIRNPNTKLTVSYDDIEALVTFDRERFGLTRLPPFVQRKKEEMTTSFQLGVMNEYSDGKVLRRIDERKGSGSVYFGVRMAGWTRFRSGIWRMRRHTLNVYCDPIEFNFSGNNGTGVFSGPAKDCYVTM
ncbi:hypothetical protein ACFE04_001018 [Oxalis oulophora]